MTPSAILAATIEIMEQQVERSGPLDLITGRYLRQRRYIGSKDRSSLMVRVFGLARRHFRIGWRLE
ncbi:MAG: rRNA cytosine-C5-methylase, partial [Rhodospirillales bacterium]